MKQREPAIAVTESAQHRRHALNGVGKLVGHRIAGLVQRRVNVEKLPQYIDMDRRIALEVAAVSQDLAGDLAIQPP